MNLDTTIKIASIASIVVGTWMILSLLTNWVKLEKDLSNQATNLTSCVDLYDQYKVVANIATATGRLPGNAISAPIGAKYTVNPDICKNVIE